MFENLEILQFPDERLRRLSHPVETFNKELKALADKMLEMIFTYWTFEDCNPLKEIIGKNINVHYEFSIDPKMGNINSESPT